MSNGASSIALVGLSYVQSGSSSTLSVVGLCFWGHSLAHLPLCFPLLSIFLHLNSFPKLLV